MTTRTLPANAIDLVNVYFGKLVFSKVEQKENYIIYAAAISSAYADGKKQYVLAFVPMHLAILKKAYLSELPWINLQTRMIQSGYKLQAQRWDLEKGLPDPFFRIVERTQTYSKYLPESDGMPFEMLLIHDPKKKSKFQYYNRMSLLGAFNTFGCVLNYVALESPMTWTGPAPEPTLPTANGYQSVYEAPTTAYSPQASSTYAYLNGETPTVNGSFELIS